MGLTGSPLQKDLMIMISGKKLTPENALNRAAALCTRSEQAAGDIRTKLKSWGISTYDADNIIKRLKEERFIDEQRFAYAFVHDKFRFAGWGKIKIAYRLKSKQIPEQAINEALANIDDEAYTSALRHILKNKLPELKGKEPLQVKASLLRFAASRGFEPDLIYRILPEFINSNDED